MFAVGVASTSNGVAATANPGGKPPLKSTGVSSAATPPADITTFQLLDSALSEEAPSSYAGMNLSGGTQVIHYVGNTLPQIQAIVSSTLGSSTSATQPLSDITYVQATATLVTLNSKQQTLDQQAANLASAGVSLGIWGVDIPTNTLSVAVVDLTPQKQAQVELVTGSANMAFISIPALPVPALSRQQDEEPWWGGDSIVGPNGPCTSGFSVHDSAGGWYDSSAGHCGNGAFKQDGNGYGVTVNTYYCNGCSGDAQIISTYPYSAEPTVWIGKTSSIDAADVTAVQSSQEPGNAVCFDGYATAGSNGLQCGTIYRTGQTVRYSPSGWLIKDQTWATTTAGTSLAVPGDSGGPVLTVTSGDANAMGIITSASSPNLNPPYIWAFYMPMANFDFDFGVSPL
jgi:hypothetical protein